MTHDDLGRCLYEHIDAQQWLKLQEVTLGPAARGEGRVDLMALKRSYTRSEIRIYEVKASRADLLTDLKKGKWERYRDYADKVIFALHDSIPWKDMLSQLPVGVTTYSEKTKRWTFRKPAPTNEQRKSWDEKFVYALMICQWENLRRSCEDPELIQLEAEKKRLLNSEIEMLYGERHQNLTKLAEEVRAERFKLRHEKKDLRKEVIKELIEEMGGHSGYFYSATPADIINRILHEPLKEILEKQVMVVMDGLREVGGK